MQALAFLDSFDPPDEPQQRAYIQAVLDGETPIAAARKIGTNPLGIMLARHASEEFNDACHLADLIIRENCLHEVVRKAMVATGSVHMVPVRDPDTGDLLLDEDFNPILAPRLVNGNPAILSKLLERLVASSDKPQAPVQVNVAQTNNNQSGGEVILIDPAANAEVLDD